MSQPQNHVIVEITDDSNENVKASSSSNQNSSSTQLYIKEIPIMKENLPHNGKPINKIAISPQSKYVLTYSQEEKSFVGWLVNDDSGPLTIDEDVEPLFLEQVIYDFKVSDKKVILYNDNNLGEILIYHEFFLFFKSINQLFFIIFSKIL